jgi:hypothetical protein
LHEDLKEKLSAGTQIAPWYPWAWQHHATAPRDGKPFLAANIAQTDEMIVLRYSPELPKFPWRTLDGPSYSEGSFTAWTPLPLAPGEVKS